MSDESRIYDPAAPIGVVDLTIKNDVQGELSLGDKEMAMLEYLADRGGEVPWSWEPSPGSKATAEQLAAVRERVADLIVGGYLVEREHITHATQVAGRLSLRLTDRGRNVVETHRARKIVASAVKPLST
jgi:hypothetical protein